MRISRVIIAFAILDLSTQHFCCDFKQIDDPVVV